MEVIRRTGIFVLTLSLAGTFVLAAPRSRAEVSHAAAPPAAKIYGKSLNDWLTAYFRWYYGTGVDRLANGPSPYRPGPAPVVFMPLPQSGDSTIQGGSWTAEDPALSTGTIHVTLPTGTGFVLPFWVWLAERYDPSLNQPDDLTIPNTSVQDSITDASATLDGRPLINSFWDYYVGPTEFNPPVVYPQPSGYGSVAGVAFQGTGVVVHPLSPGRHVLHMHELYRITPDQIPGVDFGVAFDNTWIIDVVRGRGNNGE